MSEMLEMKHHLYLPKGTCLPKDSAIPKISPSGQHPSRKWEINQKGRELPITSVNSVFIIFWMTLLLAYKIVGFFSSDQTKPKLLSLLEHFFGKAGWILWFPRVCVHVYTLESDTHWNACIIFCYFIFLYILTENKHNQMYTKSYISTGRSYPWNLSFLKDLSFSSTVCYYQQTL